MAGKESKRIVLSDPIHGSIEIASTLMKIIDTPQFQRLRHIKQLGTSCYVYPGAVHTRFEHSIGVCYIAGELVKKLQEDCRQDHRQLIDEADVLCVQIAALCHDLGHGPFSHVFDNFLKDAIENEQNKKSPLLQHEYRSVALLRELRKTKLQGEFPLEERDYKFIEALITFDKKCKAAREEKKLLDEWNEAEMGRGRDKLFLFEIVANGLTGIDVDRMDYFARDSHGCGLHSKFGWRRYIQSTRLVQCNMAGYSVYRICTRDKDEHNLCELFHVRYVLYRTVYQHKTTVIIQRMIQKALEAAKNSVKFRIPNGYVGIHECALHMEAFTNLTDSVMDLIMLGPYGQHTEVAGQERPSVIIEPSQGLAEARKILGNVQERKFPKFVGRKICGAGNDFKTFQDNLKKDFEKVAVERKFLEEEEKEKLIFLPQKFESKEKESIKKHFFYGKYHCAEDLGFPLNDDELSVLLPERSVQQEVFVYYDSDDADKKMKNLQKCLTELYSQPPASS